MAIKDQCFRCKKYTQSTDFCTETNTQPIYSSSCQTYQSRGINLDKTNDSAPVQPVQSAQPIVPVDNTSSGQRNFSQGVSNQTPLQGWKRFFSFKGRIGRGEYWLSYIVYSLYCLPMNLMEEDDIEPLFALVWLLLLVPMLWMIFAQGAKRCHDRGNSGWFQLVPFYGLWMAFAPGEENANEYGLPV